MALPELTLEILDHLGLDFAQDDSSASVLTKTDLEPEKVENLLDEAEDKLAGMQLLGFNSLVKLQSRLIDSISALLKLLKLPGASMDDIRRLIYKIGILQHEIKRCIARNERQQLINTELELELENELEKEFEERFNAPEPHYDEDLHELASKKIAEKPPAILLASETLAHADSRIEFILNKSNSLITPPFKNAQVSLRFEAKLHTLSQKLNLTCAKSKDGHTFTLHNQQNPDFQCQVTFANNGVHFSSADSKGDSLSILQSAIQAHESALSELELDTQWHIHAGDQMSALKAMDVMKACGASIDNLMSIKLVDATLPTQPQLKPTKEPLEETATPMQSRRKR